MAKELINHAVFLLFTALAFSGTSPLGGSPVGLLGPSLGSQVTGYSGFGVPGAGMVSGVVKCQPWKFPRVPYPTHQAWSLQREPCVLQQGK